MAVARPNATVSSSPICRDWRSQRDVEVTHACSTRSVRDVGPGLLHALPGLEAGGRAPGPGQAIPRAEPPGDAAADGWSAATAQGDFGMSSRNAIDVPVLIVGAGPAGLCASN